MAANAKPVEVTLNKERETKRTIRFNSEDEAAAITTLYVAKSAVEELGNPDTIKVSIAKG